MTVSKFGVNAVDVGGRSMLLTVTSGGDVIHLARLADLESSGRGAVHDFYFDSSRPHLSPTAAHYVREELLAPRWAETTLCGSVWAVMVGGEGGPLREDGRVAFAPTCRRCLTLIDRFYPTPRADRRLSLVAQLAADVVCEQGFAEVRSVPGDQQAELRKRIRKLVRARTGHGSKTFSLETTIYVECREIYDQHASEHSRVAMEALNQFLTAGGEALSRRPADWVVSWEAWDVD
ncbi:hypothetical protein CcI156_03450 [Frankia sp. CcI156]|nr:hypothetical protein [Frankia casuarinae]OHV54012.1 hypothetical protein CgIS1_13115 [Frankia sp. CgIS1]ONH29108.1 hypothetical protein CcI156_03450 [Frankia sp. CcI156]ORT94460.1 hypothetical protein UK99_16320 [Frankia casuarinae]